MKTNSTTARRGIIVVDDHPLFRKGVIQMLTQEPDLEVRAEAESSPAPEETKQGRRRKNGGFSRGDAGT